jgi:putative hydrolase of the HAD superfamily
MKSENIHNLVFDFGGVIYQIDFERQKRAFLEEKIVGFEKLYSQASQNSLFCDLETGRISDHDFRDKVTGLIGKNICPCKIDELWNSILVDYYYDKISLLQKLRPRYRLFLLSNTNAIHYNFYSAQFIKKFGYSFENLFDKSYWSFKIGMRKPDREIFVKLISDNGFTRENALFIDDTIQNTESAEGYGLTSHFLSPGENLSDLFDESLNIRL